MYIMRFQGKREREKVRDVEEEGKREREDK